MGSLKTGPLVSVIIPTYNRAATIERAVRSVLDQDYVPLELIVVDDGGADETPGLLAALATDPRLTVLRQDNRGVSAARNLGIKSSQGPLLCFLDSDDEWLPGKLAAQVEFMAANPLSPLVQTQERWIRNGRRVNPGRKHLKRAGDIFLDSVKLCLISPSAVMLRRSLLDEVGLFDETLPAAEDYDLWLRILRLHPAGLIDRELVIRYGGHPDQLSAGHSLDKYRVAALEKILGEDLTPERKRAVSEELERRKAIYLDGAAKREARVQAAGAQLEKVVE
ncbi:glycosyl transferase [Deltaproteobacteria bacterium Smac51]|nr:glycosyl transferase [Deltaproteobacteria bacterium Smac51]